MYIYIYIYMYMYIYIYIYNIYIYNILTNTETCTLGCVWETVHQFYTVDASTTLLLFVVITPYHILSTLFVFAMLIHKIVS